MESERYLLRARRFDAAGCVLDALRRRAPDCPDVKATELAALWGAQVDAIIEWMFDLSQASGRCTWHVDARPASVHELARLALWLADRVLDARVSGRDVGVVDIGAERASLATEYAQATIENTARLVTERVWNRVYDELQQRYPLIVAGERSRRHGGFRPRSEERTKRNHYVPQFTNKPWADAHGEVREFRHTVAGDIGSRVRSYADWGFEFFLYPQWLEDNFHHVETHAANGYRKLLGTVPLDDEERYYWIAFLYAQLLRTPATIAELGEQLAGVVRHQAWNYGSDPYAAHPERMRVLHHTLFRNDVLFAVMYRRLDSRRWSMFRAAPGTSFLRSDHPSFAVRGTTHSGRRWTLFYPLSPTHCLRIGPDKAHAGDAPFPLGRELTVGETAQLNRWIASRASIRHRANGRP